MQIILVALFAGLVSADVNQLINQPYYKNTASETNPISSYEVPVSSILGNGGQSLAYSTSGSASLSQFSLPSVSRPQVNFVSSTPSPSGVVVQSYSDYANSVPGLGYSAYQVSTPTPTAGASSFEVSTPAPSVYSSGFQDTSSSSNLLQYPQSPNSYQFLSSLNQPSFNLNSFGVLPSTLNNDANVNSQVSISSNAEVGLQQGISQTSGGSINDAFGVVTDVSDESSEDKEPEVTKQLYFFAAPEDEEEEQEIQAKIDLPATPQKKAYKIIFIKAPSYRNKATISVPVAPQPQEKTLVYVLVKKPEIRPTLRFQQSASSTEAPKPEVFFIKYRTQQEAEAAVAEIQSKHGASGQIISNLQAVTKGSSDGAQNGFSSTASPINIGKGFLNARLNSAVESSTPTLTNLDSRISESIDQEAPETNQQNNVAVSFARGPSAPYSITPVTFGQNSVDSLTVFGAGIAPASEQRSLTNQADAAFQSNESAKFEGQVETSTTVPSDSDETTTISQVYQNYIEQRIAESNNHDAQIVGFSAYGPPKDQK
ncbi:uncharacterized protein [Euwallacea similis]|uniref:uncharacterized protein n=1 Tax=Euwallacea similis TaxID=1736056 RepID=UPI00344E34B9